MRNFAICGATNSAEKRKLKAYDYVFNKRYIFQRFNNATSLYTFRVHIDARITEDSRRLNYLQIERIYMSAGRRIPRPLSEGIEEAQRDRDAAENGDLRGRRGCGWLRGS